MPRLEKGQVKFGDGDLPLRTCHDIRRWTGCARCGVLGSKDSMIQTSNQFWHGRCFVKQFGMERLREMPATETNKLTLGDLGVRLMRALTTQ